MDSRCQVIGGFCGHITKSISVRTIQLSGEPGNRTGRQLRRCRIPGGERPGDGSDGCEYRPGNKKENNVMKITGLNKSGDITFKRGIIGSNTLYAWLDRVSPGRSNADAKRDSSAEK